MFSYFFAFACNQESSSIAFLVVVIFVFFFLLFLNRLAFLVTLANYSDSVVKFHVYENDISCALVNIWNLALQPLKTVYTQYHNAYDNQTWQGGG